MDVINIKNKIFNRNFILISIIIVLVIIAIILFFIFKSSKKENNTDDLLIFSSNNSEISLSVYERFGFSIYHDDDYLLAVKSDRYNSNICISQASITNIRDIVTLIESDKINYITKFSNVDQVSEVKEYTLKNDLSSYNYNFSYNGNMFVDVYWIQKDNVFYVIDFNINKDNQELLSQIPEILNSIKFN